MKAGGFFPLAGIVTVWKPLNFHLTLSPTWTVMVLRKKAFESAPGGSPFTFFGGPAETVRVAACAAVGTSTVTPMATAAILRVLLKSCTSCVGRAAVPAARATLTRRRTAVGYFMVC
jgi:hypothetical protein